MLGEYCEIDALTIPDGAKWVGLARPERGHRKVSWSGCCLRHVSMPLYNLGSMRPVPVRQHPCLRAVRGSALADSPMPRANPWVHRPCHLTALDWCLYGRHDGTGDDY